MKKIYFTLLLLLILCDLSAQFKSHRRRYNLTENYFRCTLGAETEFYPNHLINTRGASLWFEVPFKQRQWSQTWNVNFFANQSRMRVHIPGGVALIAGFIIVAAPFSQDCFSGIGEDGIELLAYICRIPEGIGWMPIHRKRFHAGLYCNVLSLDYAWDLHSNTLDYFPETGIRANFYPFKKSLLSFRVGGKYSVAQQQYCGFANLSFGYDFKRITD